MDNIEVELRSFITKEQYEQLLTLLRQKAKFIKEDEQETFYFDTKEDLRIQRNKFFSKIWLKKGKMHDEHREEIEIRTGREAFPHLEKLFLTLGNNVKIKWFRTRHEFEWDGVTICIDYTKGYGYIIECEKMSTEAERAAALEELKKKFEELKIQITPKEEFDRRFKYYEQHWRELIN